LENLSDPDMLKLLIAVDELNIHPLISHIQEFMIKRRTEFLQQNIIEVLETVYRHESFTDIWNFSLKRICEEPKILFDSDEYINLKAPLLELLLKRDDINMDEIEIWENLLKWCFSQQNVMNNDPTKWSKEDMEKLYKFIPLIRFYDIEPTDFFYKVYCYKDILPQDLIHDLLEFHIVPNAKSKVNLPTSRKAYFKKLDSTLTGSDCISLFASWIDKKISSYYNKKNAPYDFSLLYRSSRDGIDTSSFHRNCDKKGATIWIAKIKDSTQLIGGYNPLDWGGYDWKTTEDSFIFNFANNSTKVSYVSKARSAIFCRYDHGPVMGNLKCDNNNWYYRVYEDGHRYPEIGIPGSFEVEDYEVFQVIRKHNV
jgi:hypothetical protein